MSEHLPTSTVLKRAYPIGWTNRTLIECGAARNGQEIGPLAADNRCWFLEADPDYFRELSTHTGGVRTLHAALTDRDGEIEFHKTSHYGNGSVEHSEIHLRELATYGNTTTSIRVPCLSYRTLIERQIRGPVDCLVLDVEGNEPRILRSLAGVPVEILPAIFVIECGYDWDVRRGLLEDLGYTLDFYHFNNGYLSHPRAKVAKDPRAIDELKWTKFEWFGQVIYDA